MCSNDVDVICLERFHEQFALRRLPTAIDALEYDEESPTDHVADTIQTEVYDCICLC